MKEDPKTTEALLEGLRSLGRYFHLTGWYYQNWPVFCRSTQHPMGNNFSCEYYASNGVEFGRTTYYCGVGSYVPIELRKFFVGDHHLCLPAIRWCVGGRSFLSPMVWSNGRLYCVERGGGNFSDEVFFRRSFEFRTEDMISWLETYIRNYRWRFDDEDPDFSLTYLVGCDVEDNNPYRRIIGNIKQLLSRDGRIRSSTEAARFVVDTANNGISWLTKKIYS